MESHITALKDEGPSGRSTIYGRLAAKQRAAIRLAAEIGYDLRSSCPELAEEYRNGLTAPMLVAKHEVDRRYGVTKRAAVSAVRNAIRGYSGYYHEAYPGLIVDKSERENLALDHNRRTGTDVYQRRVGIHGFSREQKRDACSKGGRVQGPLSYRLRIGCHALPPEVVREQLRRIASLGGKAGGVVSVLAKGMVPYVPAMPGRMGELEFASRLAAEPRYRGPVRANFGMIADKVNEVFHAGIGYYTRITMKIALQRHRRHERSGVAGPPDPEMSFADGLARDPAFQFLARIKAEEIAREVNAEYHAGKRVRNAVSIRAAIGRYRRLMHALTAAV